MSETRVSDFDRAICRGIDSDVDTACPHLVAGRGGTGRTVVDGLAREPRR